MTDTSERPAFRLVSAPPPEAIPFWTGGEQGRLLIMRCHSCRRYFHPPAPVCWRCRSFDVSPEAVSGKATVAAYTINRQPWIPGFDPPYIVAMVEIDEQPDLRLITNVIGVDIDHVAIGMPVEVDFEAWPVTGEGTTVWVPLFRPLCVDVTS
ncbi:protein of unknown function DUF35 [Mycolicibacterium rhodesiae JS60]|nr:protein of unknown function DUF35 [Mycolicibacterium rhodesiae JS60]